jgi:hypothetical protein
MHERTPKKSGGCEPAVARSYDRCAARSECCSATSEHTTRSSDRQPAVGLGNALARALPESRRRETADGVLTDAGAVAVVNHGRLTLLPAPAFRGPQWLHSRAGFPRGVYASSLLIARTHILGDARLRFAKTFCFTRGADAPRSCVGVRTSFGEKTIFAMHKRTPGSGAAGVSPPWLGHTIGVPREANVVQRRANTRPGAAIVSPPWVSVSHLQRRFH